ncbi:TPA: hypothetical protein ACUNCG_000774 [Aeromonas hydrophila]
MKFIMKWNVEHHEAPVLMETMVLLDDRHDRLSQLQSHLDDLIAVLCYGEGWALLMGDNALCNELVAWRVPVGSKLYKFMPQQNYVNGCPVAVGPVLLVHDDGVDFSGFTQQELMQLLR